MDKSLYALLCLILVSCSSSPTPAPVPKDTDWCDRAEKNLERLECKDLRGDPMWVNKNGEKFGQTCEEAQVDGRIFLNPQCIAKSIDCEETKLCPTM